MTVNPSQLIVTCAGTSEVDRSIAFKNIIPLNKRPQGIESKRCRVLVSLCQQEQIEPS